MKVKLAGYNVDTAVLEVIEKSAGRREDLTPEVLSAAYARISRDPRPIDEIRKDARTEVERARKSNSSIIFKMGHHSVAEHAVFNLDITGVSRLAMEELERFRLCSYTEKSQRYITLDKDYVVPGEIRGKRHEKAFRDIIGLQNRAYNEFLDNLKEYVFDTNAELAQDPRNHNLLEGWAKEDARYITSLATGAQVGQTVNARNLELILRRFASSPVQEVNELGRTIYNEIAHVAPSIVLFHEANDRDRNTYPELSDLAGSFLPDNTAAETPARDVELVEYTENGDATILASILHSVTGLSYQNCRSVISGLSGKRKLDIFKSAWKNLQFYDSMLREFEYVNLTFDIALSAACFGQLKRHRMSTITAQPYDIAAGVTVPESVKETGLDGRFMDIIGKTNEVYALIKNDIPVAAPYVLTNAHRRRVLIRVNARELYHISRLREDAHAQWDIRNISKAMIECAKGVMPTTFAFAGGKDRYIEIYQDIFGNPPSVTKAVLPGARSIK